MTNQLYVTITPGLASKVLTTSQASNVLTVLRQCGGYTMLNKSNIVFAVHVADRTPIVFGSFVALQVFGSCKSSITVWKGAWERRVICG